jgi:hypothetical protein
MGSPPGVEDGAAGEGCREAGGDDCAANGNGCIAPLTNEVPRLYPDYPHNDGCHPAHD